MMDKVQMVVDLNKIEWVNLKNKLYFLWKMNFLSYMGESVNSII